MADPGADRSGTGMGDPDDGVDTGFGGDDSGRLDRVGPDLPSGYNPDTGFGKTGQPSAAAEGGGGLMSQIKTWINQNLPNLKTEAKAAVATVAVAVAPVTGVLAAIRLGYNNYNDRHDAKVKAGMTPDEASAAINKENQEWGEKLDANVQHGGGGGMDIVNSLPGASTTTTGTDTAANTPTGTATQAQGSPVADSFFNRYNPGATQNAMLSTGQGAQMPTQNALLMGNQSGTGGPKPGFDTTGQGQQGGTRSMTVNHPKGGFTVENGVVTQSGNPDFPVGAQYGDDQTRALDEAGRQPTGNALTMSDPYAGLNDDMWNMYNKGYGDINSARDQGIQGINDAVASGRTDLTGYYGAARGDLEGYAKQGIGYYEPYREAGTRALGTLEERLAAGPGKFEESPGYQFRLGEGIKAMERAASARGGAGALHDPRLYMELAQKNQGYASEEYDKFINRYYQSITPYQQMVQGVGLPAAGASADIAQNTGTNLANMGMQTGTNLASLGMTGATQNALLRTNAANQTSTLGYNTAQTATANLLNKEKTGVDWGRLALAESEAGKTRDWNTTESELDRKYGREMADRGIAWSTQQNKENRNANFWNNAISAGGYIWSNW